MRAAPAHANYTRHVFIGGSLFVVCADDQTQWWSSLSRLHEFGSMKATFVVCDYRDRISHCNGNSVATANMGRKMASIAYLFAQNIPIHAGHNAMF